MLGSQPAEEASIGALSESDRVNACSGRPGIQRRKAIGKGFGGVDLTIGHEKDLVWSRIERSKGPLESFCRVGPP